MTQTIYAGDDVADILTRDAHLEAITALTAALESPNVYPKTKEQTRNAFNLPIDAKFDRVTAERSAAITAALICVEADLHDQEYEYGDLYTKVTRALRAMGRRLIDRGYGVRGWMPYDVWVLAIDHTDQWSIPPAYLRYVKQIRDIRFFDKNAITHCASTSGSYDMRFLEHQVIFEDNTPDTMREEIRDWAMEAEAEDDYYDESQIDQIIAANVPGTVYHYGNPGFSLDETEEVVKDDWQMELRRHPEYTKRELTDDEVKEGVTRKVMDGVRESLQQNSVI